MKSMYLNQALGQASEAIGRLENLVAYEHLTVVEHPQPVKEFSIQFEKVSFSYPGANQKAVDDVSFTIPQGNTVALVGASGGGENNDCPSSSPFLGGNGRESFNRWHQCKRNRSRRTDEIYFFRVPEYKAVQDFSARKYQIW